MAYVSAMSVAIGRWVEVFFVAREEEIGTCDDVGMADDGRVDNLD